MKCIIAVVILALTAINTNASVLPLAYSGVPLTPLGYGTPGISLSQGVAGVPLAYSAVSPVAYSSYEYAAPAAVVAVPAVAVPSASYLASTRGAQHAAPLPGHIQSVSSNNLAPAPGTL